MATLLVVALIVPAVLVMSIVVPREGVAHVSVILGLQPVLDRSNNTWTSVSDALVVSFQNFVGCCGS